MTPPPPRKEQREPEPDAKIIFLRRPPEMDFNERIPRGLHLRYTTRESRVASELDDPTTKPPPLSKENPNPMSRYFSGGQTAKMDFHERIPRRLHQDLPTS
jgi:hypothetical protein